MSEYRTVIHTSIGSCAVEHGPFPTDAELIELAIVELGLVRGDAVTLEFVDGGYHLLAHGTAV